MFKRFIISLYKSRVFNILKSILIKLLSDEGYYNLKDYVKKKLIVKNDQPFREQRYFGEVENRYGVNISGFLCSALGLGEAARNIIKALQSQKISFVLNNYNINRQAKVKWGFSNNYTRDNPYIFNLINVNPDQFDFFYTKSKRRYFEDKYNIGIWYWELSSLPEEWIYYYRFFHEIWVATDFILDAVSTNSPIPVIKIPPVIDLEHNPDIGKSYFNLPENSFVFLFTFDYFSTVIRKNPHSLIKAFKKAFSSNDDVILVIKTMNSKYFKEDFHDLQNKVENCFNIIIIDDYLKRETLNSLMINSDCYVSLHRSEGFGLGIAEAMYLGKPVIVTGYSGNMDFTNDDNSFLVRYKLIDIDEDYGLYKKGNVWAEPDMEHSAHLMRWVYEHRDEAAAIGKRGMSYVRENYSACSIGKKIKERLDLLADTITVQR